MEFIGGEPERIAVTGITKPFPQRSCRVPIFLAPPGMIGLNHVHIGQLDRMPGLVFRDQNLVQLLSRTNSHVLNLTLRSNRLRHLYQFHTRNFRNENLASVHSLDTTNHELNPLLERQPETSHTGVSNGNLAALALLLKYGDNTSAATHNVAISSATEARILTPGVGIGLNEHFFRAQLGGAVQIYWIHSLIRTQCQHPLHTLVDGSVDDITASHDVGLDGLERVVLAGGNLFQRGRVNHYSNPGECPLKALRIANIADEISQAGMVEPRGAHIVLLQFIAAEDDEFLRTILSEHQVHEFLAKGARSTRNEDNLVCPVHSACLLRKVVCGI